MSDTITYIINVLQALKPGNYNDLSIDQLVSLYDDFIKEV